MSRETNLIGESDSFHQVLDHASEVAKIKRPVLIIGERGTGKELIAERIHYLSHRWEEIFIKLNCATLPEELLESELFGHEAGAFTGAIKRHVGRFELGSSGTIFLDEIANMSLRLQEKMLRVVEYGEFERVGGSVTLKTDARIIAATNIDLPTASINGTFRADLLDRLAFDVITIPPLRHRKEDILLLSEHFAIKMTRELGGKIFPGFSSHVKEELMSYSWPGNIRELKNIIERSVYKSFQTEGPVNEIQIDPFESPFRPTHETIIDEAKPGIDVIDITDVKNQFYNIESDKIDFKATVSKFEKKLLEDALFKCKNNKSEAAKFLNLTYNQLRGILRKLFT